MSTQQIIESWENSVEPYTPRKPKRAKLFHYGHPRALFCSRACREGFREDRRQGLIYGPYYLQDLGRFAMSAEEWSAHTHTCPYCNTKEGQPIE